MAAFPVAAASSTRSMEDAAATIQLRYQSLLDSLVDSEAVTRLLDSTSETFFSPLFASLARLSHRTLYGEILANAGKYRQPTEADGGAVYFGPQSKGPAEFTGTSASKIESELTGAFRHLSKTTSDPVASAVTFYQQFVRIHPFYDANGRITRLLVSVYLDYHGRYVDWDDLQRQGKWIHHLNNCHKRQGQKVYDTYLGRLIDYFARHVRLKSEFEFGFDE